MNDGVERIRRKLSYNRGPILAFDRGYGGKLRKISDRVLGAPDEIRAKHLPDACLEC
jgi:hypothetical protein